MHSLFHGVIPDSNVRDALVSILPLWQKEWVAVIRSVDSASLPEDITKILSFHNIRYNVINRNIHVSLCDIQIALDVQVFTGFDEIWIIDGEPCAYDLNALPAATSDVADFSRELPYELKDAIRKTNSVLVLADGCNLNYVAIDEELRRAVAQ